MRGLVPVAAWVGSDSPRERSAALLDGLWEALVDNAVPRVLAHAPAETVEAARRELRRFGETAMVLPLPGERGGELPLWGVLAAALVVPGMQRQFRLGTEIVTDEAARLLWRWVADPSTRVPPQSTTSADHFHVDLRPAEGHWAVELAASAGWTGRALWRSQTGSAGPEQATVVPLTQVVPHARVAAGVPTPFAAGIRELVGGLLGQLPHDTAGVFEAQLATAQVVSEYLTHQAGLSVGERAGLLTLQQALSNALYESLGSFGRAAVAGPAVEAPAPGAVVHPEVGAQPNAAVAAAHPQAAAAEAGPGRRALESLPPGVREAAAGLTPAVRRVATSSWSVPVVIDGLIVLRDTFAAQAAAAVLPDAPADIVDVTRQEVVRLWDGAGFGPVLEGTSSATPPIWRQLVDDFRALDWARAARWRLLDRTQAQATAVQRAQERVVELTQVLQRDQAELESARQAPGDAARLARAGEHVREFAVQLAEARADAERRIRELAQLQRDEQDVARRLREARERSRAASGAAQELARTLATRLAARAAGADPGPARAVAHGEQVADGATEAVAAVAATVRRLAASAVVSRHLTERAVAILGRPTSIPAAALAGLATVGTAEELLREASRLWTARLQGAELQDDPGAGGSLPVPEPFGVRLPAAEEGALRLRLAEVRVQLAGQLLGASQREVPAGTTRNGGALPGQQVSSWEQVHQVAATGLSQVMRAWAFPVDDGARSRLPSGAAPEQLVQAVRGVVAEAVRRLPDHTGTALRGTAGLNRIGGPHGDGFWSSVADDVAALRTMPSDGRQALHDDVLARVAAELESLRQPDLTSPERLVPQVGARDRGVADLVEPVRRAAEHVVPEPAAEPVAPERPAPEPAPAEVVVPPAEGALALLPAPVVHPAQLGRWTALAIVRAGATLRRTVALAGRRLAQLRGELARRLLAGGLQQWADDIVAQVIEPLRALIHTQQTLRSARAIRISLPPARRGQSPRAREAEVRRAREEQDPSTRLARILQEDNASRLPGDIAFDILRRGLLAQAPRELLSRVESLRVPERDSATEEEHPELSRLTEGMMVALGAVLLWAGREFRSDQNRGAPQGGQAAAGAVAVADGAGPEPGNQLPEGHPRFAVERDLRALPELERSPETAEVLAFVRTLRELYQARLAELADQRPAAEASDAGQEREAALRLLEGTSGPVADESWALLGSRTARFRIGNPHGLDLREVAELISLVVKGQTWLQLPEVGGGRGSDPVTVHEPVPGDRVGSAWGVEGLSESFRRQLLRGYERDRQSFEPTVRTLVAFASGAVSEADLVAFLSARGQRFLASGVPTTAEVRRPRWQFDGPQPEIGETSAAAGARAADGVVEGRAESGTDLTVSRVPERAEQLEPVEQVGRATTRSVGDDGFVVQEVPIRLGRESWAAAGADLPTGAAVRFLDAGVELAMHDLTFALHEWSRTATPVAGADRSDAPTGQGEGQRLLFRGPFATVDLTALALRLLAVYRQQLQQFVHGQTARATMVSASRSLAAVSGDAADQAWRDLGERWSRLQAGELSADVSPMTLTARITRLLTQRRPLVVPVSVPGPDEPARPGGALRALTRPHPRSPRTGREDPEQLVSPRGSRPSELDATGAVASATTGPVAELSEVLTDLFGATSGAGPLHDLTGQTPTAAGVARAVVLLTEHGRGSLVGSEPDAAGGAGAVRALDTGVELALNGLLTRAGRRSGATPGPLTTEPNTVGTAVPAPEVAEPDGPRTDSGELVQALQEVYRIGLESLLLQADVHGSRVAAVSLQTVVGRIPDASWRQIGEQLARLERGEISGPDVHREVAEFLATLGRRREAAAARQEERLAGKGLAVDSGSTPSHGESRTTTPDDAASPSPANPATRRSRGTLTIGERTARADPSGGSLGERVNGLWWQSAQTADTLSALLSGAASAQDVLSHLEVRAEQFFEFGAAEDVALSALDGGPAPAEGGVLGERLPGRALPMGAAADTEAMDVAVAAGEAVVADGSLRARPLPDQILGAQAQLEGTPADPVDVAELSVGTGAVAVRWLDVGVELALHDLVFWAGQEALRLGQGSAVTPTSATTGGFVPREPGEDDPVRSGSAGPGALVGVLREVYRERLRELRGEASTPAAAAAGMRSWAVVEGPAAEAVWSDLARRVSQLWTGDAGPDAADALPQIISTTLTHLRATAPGPVRQGPGAHTGPASAQGSWLSRIGAVPEGERALPELPDQPDTPGTLDR
ncbi:MAG TPA: hypothetical protein VFP72_09125 [Kineosporiaceae bacterium]|nr:hypothetical protein [Kineosporiaceae bacterium]